MFDFSSYPEDSKFFDPTDKKVIRKIKDESEGKIIDEFVRLKSKMYSMKILMVKNLIQQNQSILQLSLMNSKTLYSTKNWSDIKWEKFSAKQHKMWTYKINKIPLSAFDDKRFLLNNGIHTFEYFHERLKQNRFSQMIINKKRFKKILIKKEILTNGYK